MSLPIFPTLSGAQVDVERERIEETTIQTEASGRELGISRQSAPRFRWRIRYDFLRQDSGSNEAATLLGFHAANRGRFGRFLFSDPYDDAVTLQEFALGDGTTTAFQLQCAPGGVQYDALGGGPVYTVSRQNYLVRSQEFDNGSWAKNNVTATANVGLAPDGTATADWVSETTTGAAQHYMSNGTAPAGVVTYSVYAKAAERSWLWLRLGGSSYAKFNLGAGTTSGATACTSAIESVGNGWYRCSITVTAAGGEAVLLYLLDGTGQDVYAGAAGNGLYLWGAQVEDAAAATRYIPAVASPVVERPAWWPGGAAGWEPVKEPIWPSVTIRDGASVVAVGSGWTPGSGGVVTFASPPTNGHQLVWSGSFLRRVRFDSDREPVQRRVSRVWQGEVSLISVL